jgi:dienelactone hydrolase
MQSVTLSTSDGVHLAALEAGSGSRGVVLVPESGRSGKCGWTNFAGGLSGKGYHVILFDDRCQGGSECPASGTGTGPTGPAAAADIAAAVARLHQDGAERIVLIGASAGATASLYYAAQASSAVNAVVALSADELAGRPGGLAAVRIPALVAVASGDPNVTESDSRSLFADLGTAASDKHLDVLPAGSGHGWDLTSTSAPASFNDELTAFMTSVLPDPRATPLDSCLTVAQTQIVQVDVASQNETIPIALLGHGPRTIVLSNQSDKDLCAWQQFAQHLVGNGYRVALWDYDSGAPVDDLTAIVAKLRAGGASSLILAGASKGAKASIVAAAGILPPVSAVVSLSAEPTLATDIQVVTYVKQLKCPLLLLTADEDQYGSAGAAHDLMAAAPNAAQLKTYPGDAHGVDLLEGSSGVQVQSDIDAFLSTLK